MLLNYVHLLFLSLFLSLSLYKYIKKTMKKSHVKDIFKRKTPHISLSSISLDFYYELTFSKNILDETK